MSVTQLLRSFSTKTLQLSTNKNALRGRNLVEAVAVSRNGRTVVAWHPELEFPYEFTKPLPVASEKQYSSLIKDEALASAMGAFKEKKPEVARAELMRLTHTTKHRWFPRSRDKRAKSTPMDRPYL